MPYAVEVNTADNQNDGDQRAEDIGHVLGGGGAHFIDEIRELILLDFLLLEADLCVHTVSRSALRVRCPWGPGWLRAA